MFRRWPPLEPFARARSPHRLGVSSQVRVARSRGDQEPRQHEVGAMREKEPLVAGERIEPDKGSSGGILSRFS